MITAIGVAEGEGVIKVGKVGVSKTGVSKTVGAVGDALWTARIVCATAVAMPDWFCDEDVNSLLRLHAIKAIVKTQMPAKSLLIAIPHSCLLFFANGLNSDCSLRRHSGIIICRDAVW